MRPDSQMKNTAEPASSTIDKMTSQSGGSNASLAGMSTGENSGIMLPQVANELVGLSMTGVMSTIAMMMGATMTKKWPKEPIQPSPIVLCHLTN